MYDDGNRPRVRGFLECPQRGPAVEARASARRARRRPGVRDRAISTAWAPSAASTTVNAVGLELEAEQAARALVVVDDQGAAAAARRDRRHPGRRLGLAARQFARQGDREGRALARVRSGRATAAAEQQGELADDREAEAGPAAGLVRRGFSLAKFLEDRLLLLVRNADPRVRDDEGPLPAWPRGSARTSMLPFSVNFRALPTRLARIWVSFAGSLMTVEDRARRASCRSSFFRARGILEIGLDLLEQRRDRDDLAVQLGLSGFDLGNVEHVVDEAEQKPRVALDALQALLLLGVELALSAPQQRSR